MILNIETLRDLARKMQHCALIIVGEGCALGMSRCGAREAFSRLHAEMKAVATSKSPRSS